jgi:very-short-patch-repair endonuclease
MDSRRMIGKVAFALHELDQTFIEEAPIGPFFADFLVPSLRLVIEVDGGVHKFPRQRLRDAHKNQYYKSHGYQYLRLEQAHIERSKWLLSKIKTKIGQITGKSYWGN